jgi:hypothetical protein
VVGVVGGDVVIEGSRQCTVEACSVQPDALLPLQAAPSAGDHASAWTLPPLQVVGWWLLSVCDPSACTPLGAVSAPVYATGWMSPGVSPR